MPFPPPEALPDPGIEPSSLLSPALAGGFLTTSTTWEAPLEPSFSPKAASQEPWKAQLALCAPKSQTAGYLSPWWAPS